MSEGKSTPDAILVLRGHSDDILSYTLNGVADEAGCWGQDVYLATSTGDVFRAEYDPPDDPRGVWSITHPVVSGKLAVRTEPVGPGDDPEPYSPVVTATGPIEWVQAWDNWPPTREDIIERIGNTKLIELEDAVLCKLHDTLYPGRLPPE